MTANVIAQIVIVAAIKMKIWAMLSIIAVALLIGSLVFVTAISNDSPGEQDKTVSGASYGSCDSGCEYYASGGCTATRNCGRTGCQAVDRT